MTTPSPAAAPPALSLRDKAAQLVFARIGSNMEPAVTVAEDEVRVTALLDRCALGGLVLFNGSAEHTPPLLARLQRQSRLPLLIAADIERGVGQQIAGATVFPHARAFGALGAAAEALTERAAGATAREALACGLHITFAPVADVNHCRDNPIIATRAFADEAAPAARLVRAYLRGCHQAGLYATAKHFPGHGGTSEDSHETMPEVRRSREALEAVDLVPFRAAIDEGVDLMMTAHVRYPALDPEGRPATLSPPILDGLLRRDLGFEGPVISDSLLMGAMKDTHADVGAQAVALFQAGADIILDPLDPEAVVEGLVQAVEAGTLAGRELDEAFARVWRLKAGLLGRFGEHVFTDPVATFGPAEVDAAAHRALAAEVARRSITVRTEAEGAWPLGEGAGRDTLVVLVKPYRRRLDAARAPLADALAARLPEARYAELGPEATPDERARLTDRADEMRHVVVALVVKPAAWHSFGLLPEQHAFVRGLIDRRAARGAAVVLGALGSDRVFDDLPGAGAYLCTYSDVPASQEAFVRCLVEGGGAS